MCSLLRFLPLNLFRHTQTHIHTHIGFLIIPKRVEQNQTRIFDRDKFTSASISPSLISSSSSSSSSGNFTVPNSIIDSSKNINPYKSVKHTSSSDGMKFNTNNNSKSNSTNNNNNNVNNTSSNQLLNETNMETSFSTANYTNITSQVGSIVEIPCTVQNLGEGTVS